MMTLAEGLGASGLGSSESEARQGLNWAHTPGRCPHHIASQSLAPLGLVRSALASQRTGPASWPPAGSVLPSASRAGVGAAVAAETWMGPGGQRDPGTKIPPRCQDGGQGLDSQAEPHREAAHSYSPPPPPWDSRSLGQAEGHLFSKSESLHIGGVKGVASTGACSP